MLGAKAAILVVLGIFLLGYALAWIQGIRQLRRSHAENPTGPSGWPNLLETGIGFVTNFFDTLGIGSYAPTTSIYKLCKVVSDEQIPGTLNVGHTPATITQAFIFIAIVEVDTTTLVLLITASILGAWLGAGVVAAWPRRKIQLGMGVALLVAATIFLLTNLRLLPGGGATLGLTGFRLAVGVLGNFFLGALMTLGIGLYAPCMILLSLLGMNPITAFPIMMGSCAFLMPVASIRFIRKQRYRLRPALGLVLGGVPAVLIAAFIVKALPLTAVRWLVVGVVVYAATAMLRSVAKDGLLFAQPSEP